MLPEFVPFEESVSFLRCFPPSFFVICNKVV